MALKSTLGFGMMRLPVKNGDPTDFDYEQLNEMVDTYLAAGYNYFDTPPTSTTTAGARRPCARPW